MVPGHARGHKKVRWQGDATVMLVFIENFVNTKVHTKYTKFYLKIFVYVVDNVIMFISEPTEKIFIYAALFACVFFLLMKGRKSAGGIIDFFCSRGEKCF